MHKTSFNLLYLILQENIAFINILFFRLSSIKSDTLFDHGILRTGLTTIANNNTSKNTYDARAARG